MPGLHSLDRVIGDEWPILATGAAVRAFESVPYEERIAARSTYDALRCGMERDPSTPALLFLPNASADDEPLCLTHRSFFARVTQTANALHALGVGPSDVVSLMLPLVPQAFYALYGAQAAGIVNPINAFLEAGHIAHILRAARTKVLVTLGPTQGFDIWEKVTRIRGELPDLRAVLVVGATAGLLPEGAQDFDALIATQNSNELASGRHIQPGDVAAYYHTGGTTGVPPVW
jgi:fatty-acyl-CoA synthase